MEAVTQYKATPWRYIMARERLPSGEDIFTMRKLFTGPQGQLSWTGQPVIPQGCSAMECSQEIVALGNALWRRELLDLTMSPPKVVRR